MRGLLGCALVVLTAWPADGQDKPADAVRGVLTEQVAAWNKGDLDRFMGTYWDSDELTFYSGGTVTKGRKAVAERYRKTYQAEGKEMGKLTFSDLDVRLLPGRDGEARYAVVTGRFHLDRAAHGEIAQDDGVFSLLWEKTADGWKIILDHTS